MMISPFLINFYVSTFYLKTDMEGDRLAFFYRLIISEVSGFRELIKFLLTRSLAP